MESCWRSKKPPTSINDEDVVYIPGMHPDPSGGAVKQSSMEVRNLKPGFAALGVVMDFLARDQPFANMKAGDLLAAITYQLSLGHHVAGFENSRLVAYCGWITPSTAGAEAWL